MSEKHLVNQVINYLLMRGCIATRVNAGVMMIGSGEVHDKKRSIRLAPAGTADIIACIGGTYVAIECKVGKNIQTPSQVRFEEQVRAAGGDYVVIRTLEDIIEVVTNVLLTSEKPNGKPFKVCGGSLE